MNKLSVVIITHNAARKLEEVLLQAKKVSNDVLIVDSGSTDNTLAIAEKCLVRIIKQDWLGYGAQKNFGNTHANNDWVLSIDADEVLSDKLIAELNSMRLETGEVYSIPFINHYCGAIIRHGRWKNEKHIRLFQRSKVAWNKDGVHEGLLLGDAKIVSLKNPIIHYSMDSKAMHLEKAKSYAQIGAKKLFKQGKKSSFIKRFINPVFRFVMDFFVSLGFLDGQRGFQIALITAKETYWKYKTLKQLRS